MGFPTCHLVYSHFSLPEVFAAWIIVILWRMSHSFAGSLYEQMSVTSSDD